MTFTTDKAPHYFTCILRGSAVYWNGAFCFMKKIELSKTGKHKGKYFALVDDEDYERLSNFRYQVYLKKGEVYGQRRIKVNGALKLIMMHHDVIGNPPPGFVIDHANNCGVDNTKCNLRFVTHAQNMANARKIKKGLSKYKGVTAENRGELKKKWKSSIYKDGVVYRLGNFENEGDAARAYDHKAKELNGEFAYLNFPDK